MGVEIERDLARCQEILGAGSKSFSFAALALPKRLRQPVAAFYAFCRVSDDAIDESADPGAELVKLRARLDAAAEGHPESAPVDRALAWLFREFDFPRAPLDFLLEGYLWDAERRRYATLNEVMGYGVRVAGSVGAGMTALMGPRDRATLARAVDLGVAMQLTNIARDVGEDARESRFYLPTDWLDELGFDLEPWLGAPTYRPALGHCVRRLLDQADFLYGRAEDGIERLPSECRLAIRAASRIYAEIGKVIRDNRYDSVGTRARTSRGAKARLLWSAFYEGERRRARSLFGSDSHDDRVRNRRGEGASPLREAQELIDAMVSRSQMDSDWARDTDDFVRLS